MAKEIGRRAAIDLRVCREGILKPRRGGTIESIQKTARAEHLMRKTSSF